jgi:uncharacterized membrane protein
MDLPMTDVTPPPADEPIPTPEPVAAPEPVVTPAPAPEPVVTPAPAPDYVPAPPAAPVAAPQNGLGTAALVMAILQFVCLGPIASILAIIFGRMGMNKAKQGLATNGGVAKASFWLGIVGLILTVIGGIIAVVVIGIGVSAAVDTVDPAKNSQTGLADGNYGMEPTSSIFLNDRCAFGGAPISIETEQSLDTTVTVVGEGSSQCGPSMDTPQYVIFSVSGGVAQILEVG